MTGFRVALGGAQARYGVAPDLSTFGKVIGGGMPVGAYGGRRDLMEQIAPSGPIYQAGTLSRQSGGDGRGAGDAGPGAGARLSTTRSKRKTNALCDGLEAAAREAGVPFTTQRVGGMFGMFFTSETVDTYRPGDGLRQRRVQPLLPRDAGARRVPGALGVRGRLHVQRARRRCHRPTLDAARGAFAAIAH